MKTNTVSLSLASLAESIAFAVHAQPRIRDEKKTYEDNADDMKNYKLNFEFFSKLLTKVNICN